MQADEQRFAIILGAGAAGIIQGYAFLREDVLPLEEFHILDRNESFGGVWWSNTYPGAACDIPSNEYCISSFDFQFSVQPTFPYITFSSSLALGMNP